MTDTPKPFTADEIAAIEKWAASYFSPPFQHMAHGYFLRLIATIEQQAEQIEKLHGFVRRIRGTAGIPNAVEACRLICNLVDEALAATEPVNDKR